MKRAPSTGPSTSVSVNVSELKDRLSHYLRVVQSGRPVLIRDRDRIVARIEPAGASSRGTDDDRVASLERRGILRRRKGKPPPAVLREPIKTKADVVQALIDERSEGR